MNKITHINLNGRAFKLEEQGYQDLHAYLENAKRSLRSNPDQKEILEDLETAIADKCERKLTKHKEVISTTELTAILEQMGPVEAENDEKIEETKAPPSDAEQTKRLFVIPRGAMLVGVCNGIAAYFGADPMIVRIIFIALTAITGGFWIIVYVLLALILPYARTKEDLAEAYGKPVTAQAIIERATQRAPNPEAIDNLTSAAVKIGRILSSTIAVLCALLFGILTAAWVVTMWALLFGYLRMPLELAYIASWEEGVAISAIYASVSLPILLVSRVASRIAGGRRQTRRAAISEGILAVTWGIAVAAMAATAIGLHGPVRDYVHSHGGYLDVGDSHICLDSSRCDAAPEVDSF